MPNSQLFLIDAHALCYRAYYAIKGLSTSSGHATNAVYGFVNILRRILKRYHPKYVAVCFDVSADTHRREKFAEYKIHRPQTPDDLISQIPVIKEVIEAYNLPIFELEGYEADDVIATIVKKVKGKGIESVIVSDDKDMFQLAGDAVKVFSARKDKILGYREIKESLGFQPEYISDYIGLAGDATDNIPGVVGIGKVSAAKLINEYGSLEAILGNIDRIKPPSVRSKLEGQEEKAIFSKELALLHEEVPIDFKMDDVEVGEPDKEKLFEIFNRLEFRKFASEFAEHASSMPKLTTKLIDSADAAKKLFSEIKTKKMLAYTLGSLEETEEYRMDSIFACLDDKTIYQIPFKHVSALKDVLESKTIAKVTYDIKESLKVLSQLGCEVKGEVFDVMLAGYLLFPSRTSYDISSLTWQYLKVSIPESGKLASETGFLLKLYDCLKKDLEEKDLLDLLKKIEIPLAHVLFEMEKEGVAIDKKLLKQLSAASQKRIDELMKELYDLAGEEFNLNSPKQLAVILFEKLKLPPVKKTKTGFSTNEEVLVKLSAQHPLPALLLEYRKLAKLKSTYIDALPELINEKTGRIHCSFNQAITETGRLSSNHPNLQNIPIRTEFGRQIRRAFVPSHKDHVMISADYSQIELRILAHLSKDENLIKAFKEDEDIHTYTAALIFDVKEKNVSSDMRNSAKRVNFGIIYGMSAFGLAKDLHISNIEAQAFIDRYFNRYPKVKEFMDNEIAKCEKDGYVSTILHRRRYIPEINSSNMTVRQFAQRQAINTPVQGSAADLIKLAMINIQEEMKKKKLASRMIITVHDELVFDVPQKEEEDMVALIRSKMEKTLDLSVPIRVDIKVGKNWLETKIK